MLEALLGGGEFVNRCGQRDRPAVREPRAERAKLSARKCADRSRVRRHR